MSTSEQFGKAKAALANKGYFLHLLDEENLDVLLASLCASTFSRGYAPEIVPLLLAEKNNRSADKMARTGLLLAGVAVAVGIVQIILAVIPLCKC